MSLEGACTPEAVAESLLPCREMIFQSMSNDKNSTFFCLIKENEDFQKMASDFAGKLEPHFKDLHFKQECIIAFTELHQELKESLVLLFNKNEPFLRLYHNNLPILTEMNATFLSFSEKTTKLDLSAKFELLTSELSRLSRPSELLISPKPSKLSISSRPSEPLISPKPSKLSISSRSSEPSISPKPSKLSISSRSSESSISPKPSKLSISSRPS